MFILLTIIACAFLSIHCSPLSVAMEIKASPEEVEGMCSQPPPVFVENKGQWEESILFMVRGEGRTLCFSSHGLTLVLNVEDRSTETVTFEFINAREDAILWGLDRIDTTFSFFKGAPDQWKTRVACYNEVIYEDLWPDIDLVFSAQEGQIKYRYEVKPGADPDQIRLKIHGASDLRIDSLGELVIKSDTMEIRDPKPFVFQNRNDAIDEISSAYRVNEDAAHNEYSLGFTLGNYDQTKSLVIDPAILLFCGYIGGDHWDRISRIKMGPYGNVYIVGYTRSSMASFPAYSGPDLTYNGDGDVFVAKLHASGTHFEYCGYIGGNNEDFSVDIDVDSDGNAYVVGWTKSTENDGFPVTVGPDLTYNGGDSDLFVAKVNAAGTSLEYCGYIGGEKDDCCEGPGGIAVDAEGNAYVTSTTKSDQTTFPVKIGPSLTHKGGGYDVCVAKVNPSGQDLEYCGYIGGTSWEVGNGIAVDSLGNAYVCGSVKSSESQGFPVVRGPDLTFNGGWCDTFVAKVNPTGSGLVFCGYIGGLEADNGLDIALDESNHYIYITGVTASDENSFPVVNGPDLYYNSGPNNGRDAYVAKINIKNTNIEYCGYVGGDDDDFAWSIDVDSSGNAYIVGETQSRGDTFPVKEGPILTHHGIPNDYDAFIASISPDGAFLNYCGYIGGNITDYGYAVAVDDLGNACMAGETYSSERYFPVLNGPDLTLNSHYDPDGFIAKVIQKGVCCDKYRLSSQGDRITFDLLGGRENANRPYLLLGSLDSTNPGFPLPGGKKYLPFFWDGLTDSVLLNLNSSVFYDFAGILSRSGNASAQLVTDQIRPEFVGRYIYFAYCLNNPYNFVSNPVGIKITE